MLGQWGDSLQSQTLANTPYIATNSTTTTTTGSNTAANFTGSWDNTLKWKNTLPQVNLLKSVGNGSEVFVRQTTNNNYRKGPVQLSIWL